MKTLQRTLSFIKPDAVERGAAGDINHTLLENKFRIIGMRMLHIDKAQAEGFYAVHVHRPFFESLTNFMSSGPIVVMALEKEDAIADYRKLMGATDPAKAEEGTIRKKWASSIEENAVHGSDAEDTARFELSYFFCRIRTGKITSLRCATCICWLASGGFMAHVQITMLSGRTMEQKRRAVKRITEILTQELHVKPEKLTIAFVEVPRESYARNGTLMSDRQDVS